MSDPTGIVRIPFVVTGGPRFQGVGLLTQTHKCVGPRAIADQRLWSAMVRGPDHCRSMSTNGTRGTSREQA